MATKRRARKQGRKGKGMEKKFRQMDLNPLQPKFVSRSLHASISNKHSVHPSTVLSTCRVCPVYSDTVQYTVYNDCTQLYILYTVHTQPNTNPNPNSPVLTDVLKWLNSALLYHSVLLQVMYL